MKAATVLAAAFNMDKAISIHAAREGGDTDAYSDTPQTSVFQSTPPVKAATYLFILFYRDPVISIHAAREGGDFVSYLVF